MNKSHFNLYSKSHSFEHFVSETDAVCCEYFMRSGIYCNIMWQLHVLLNQFLCHTPNYHTRNEPQLISSIILCLIPWCANKTLNKDFSIAMIFWNHQFHMQWKLTEVFTTYPMLRGKISVTGTWSGEVHYNKIHFLKYSHNSCPNHSCCCDFYTIILYWTIANCTAFKQIHIENMQMVSLEICGKFLYGIWFQNVGSSSFG